jgi:hypothetical protein
VSSESNPESKSSKGLGLCADCIHGRLITSDKGSTFLQCQLSFSDFRYPKYPRLPVLHCSGYEKKVE